MKIIIRTVLRSGTIDGVETGVEDEVHRCLCQARKLREIKCLLWARGPEARRVIRPVVRVDSLREIEPKVANSDMLRQHVRGK